MAILFLPLLFFVAFSMMHVKMMYRSVGLVKGRVFLLYLSKTSFLVWERLDIMSGVIVISGGVVLSSI